MKTSRIYSIRDLKSETYWVPFFQDHEIMAQRSFIKLILDKDMMPSQFPEDFELWQLGEWNNETGKFKQNYKIILEGSLVAKKYKGES